MSSEWVLDYSRLLPVGWESSVDAWFQEDAPSFDYGGFVVGGTTNEATLWCKQNGVLCGRPFVDHIFKRLDCQITWFFDEGAFIEVSSGRTKVATVTGPANRLLLGERNALNLMARASGIATRAREVSQAVKKVGFSGVVAGTRKTTPGFRLVEKYALIVGGCDQHRYDLSSMIMLKDNHIWSSGSITEAVRRAKSVGGFALKVEVECQSQAEAEEAINAGADIVMLDNFNPIILKQTAQALKSKHAHVIVEASGGITAETVAEYCCPHVDVISMGSLTQGVPHIDFSLKIVPARSK